MHRHIDEISQSVAPSAHAILIVDQAVWHTSAKLDVAANINILPFPLRSPELNQAENVWQFMRDIRLSNRMFHTYDDIIISAATP